ncbi:hypothetical protein LX32DRAFT_562909 [Colletotrichum zoysiae]|uniref:Pathway-specific nitrogen regulator n=1 Tax=Colletotrichum zoysiae TaxID=1216348 RepID=A0AAD9HHT3_9PEZI|nr:hypothetical protein LX32DRAFT_562909 [Colletotrichum zoysiae]
MPSSGPKPEDLDFEIHVDPSCVSTPAHEVAEPQVMADDDDKTGVTPAEPAVEEEKVPVVEAEAEKEGTPAAAEEEVVAETEETKDEDEADPEPASEPAAEAASEEPVETTSEETDPAAESADTTDDREADAEAEAEAEAEVVPAQDDVPAADEDTNVAAQDEPNDADAKSDKDLAEQCSGLAAADGAEPEEPELKSEPALEAEEEDPAQAESEPPSQDQSEEVVEEEEEKEKEETEELAPEESEEPEAENPPHPKTEAETAAATEPEPEVETATAAEPELEPEVEMEEDGERGRSLQPAAEITPTADEATEDHEEPAAVQDASRSSSSLRRASGRTEALIHAAAKEVLERLEAQTMETMRNRSHSRQDSTGSTNHGTELHYDVRSGESRRESYNTESRASRRESYKTESRASRRESYNTQPRSSRRGSEFRPAAVHAEDAADSSSQHGDSDVFSDRSPRSSLGSFDGHVDHHKDESNRSSKRSSHIPDDVSMSEMSYYDKEEFVPTIRGTNRMPFRSPSDVRALQYSSPAPSVTGSYSPRSAKRAHMPAVSRLGSPTVSGQYTTAKARKTPTRFNPPKKEPAPLVLLHVTLLPLRWQWADILEQTSSDALSPAAKTLREAWHHLHDRVADTVCERGILLSHPQEDYEILEERLLEALDLPLRRRARVLECGHYIGPSNEMTLGEDADSDEDEYGYDEDGGARRRSGGGGGALARTHWCQTCRHDIRCESLGPGKIFRIKVYASNGLMRTGAWAACWKEMERVDVEIEPVVESAVLDELERLVFAQSQQMQLVRHDPAAVLESTEGRDLPEEDHGMPDFDRGGPSSVGRDARSLDRGSVPALEENNLLEPSYADREAHVPAAPSPSSPIAAGDARSPSPGPMPDYDESEERRLRDEERMREIYGHPPPPEFQQHHEPTTPEPPHPESRHDSFSAQSPPPPHSPSPAAPHQQQPEPQQAQQPQHQPYPPHQPAGPEAAYHPARPQGFQNAGLGELLLEAARVFMQDKKNLAIVVMGLLVLFMAVRPAPRAVRDWDGKFVEHVAPAVSEPPATAAAPPLMEAVRAVVESVAPAGEAAPPAQVVVRPTTPDVEVAAGHDDREVPAAEATASVVGAGEPAESTSTSTTAQTSAVEEETRSPAPSPSSPAASEEVVAAAPAPAPVHETIITRELVRVVETVTETVKAVVTETEVVRVQATSGAVPEVPVEEEAAAAAQSETPLEDGTVEEAPAAETALPVEEPVVDEQIAEEQQVEEDSHDEL